MIEDLRGAVAGVVEEAVRTAVTMGPDDDWTVPADQAIDRIMRALGAAAPSAPFPVDLDEVRQRGLQVARIMQMVTWAQRQPAVLGLHLSGDVGGMLQEISYLRAALSAHQAVMTREEWGIQHYDGEIGPVAVRPERIHSPNIHLHRRVVDTLVDGSVRVGPWSLVVRDETGDRKRP